MLIIQQLKNSPISSYNYTPFEYDELKISDLDNTDWDIYTRNIIKKQKEFIEKKSRDGRLKKRNLVLRNILLLKND